MKNVEKQITWEIRLLLAVALPVECGEVTHDSKEPALTLCEVLELLVRMARC